LSQETHIIEGLSAFLIFFSHSLEGSSMTNTNTYLCNPGCVVRVCVLSHIFKEPTNVSIPHERRGCKSKHTPIHRGHSSTEPFQQRQSHEVFLNEQGLIIQPELPLTLRHREQRLKSFI